MYDKIGLKLLSLLMLIVLGESKHGHEKYTRGLNEHESELVSINSLFADEMQTSNQWSHHPQIRATGKKKGNRDDQTTVPPPGKSTVVPPGISTVLPPGISTQLPPPGTSPSPTIAPPPDVSNWTYVGFYNGKFFWISVNQFNKSDAINECDGLGKHFESQNLLPWGDMNFYIPVLDSKLEQLALEGFLRELELGDAWVGGEIHVDENGKEYVIKRTPAGVQIVDIDVGMGKSKRRRQVLVSYSSLVSDKLSRRRKRQENEPNQVQVMEVHYPWLDDWKNQEGGCKDISGCEPVNCTVTTPECFMEMVPCTLGNATSNCRIIKTANCTAICENCEITVPPECWMAATKCMVMKERECKMEEPECHIETPPCSITRPPCVTKELPCNATNPVDPPECKVPDECGTPQGVNCTTIPRNCSEAELEAGLTNCTGLICDPLPICLTPEYCREIVNGTLSFLECPPPIQFCPPVVVKCPPPNITCDEPVLNCTDPVIYCPPPQVICTQPVVKCKAPSISCPTVVAECQNPPYHCSKPIIDCPPPTVECTPPKACYAKPPKPTCPTKCSDENNCTCIYLKRSDEDFNLERSSCSDLHYTLCTAEGPVGGPFG